MGVARKKAYVLIGADLVPKVESALETAGIGQGSATDSSLAVVGVGNQQPQQDMVVVAARLPTLAIGPESRMVEAVNAGCRGFVTRDCDPESLSEALRAVAEGGAYIPPAMLGPLLRMVVDRNKVNDVDLSDLTEREREVFHLAADGARKEEIGERLFISPATARTHLQRVYKKLGVHSQSELMALSRRNGSEP